MKARRKIRIIVAIAIWTMSSIIVNGQSETYFQKSPRPPSFITVLPGLSSYNFDCAKMGLFPEAYFIAEIRGWIEATRPGIMFGIDYRRTSTEHVTISYSFPHNLQLGITGYWWYISNIIIKFTIESLNYEYAYKVPNFRIAQNDFDDHTLYNLLLDEITRYIHPYDKSRTLRLPEYPSGYDEAKLKNIWKADGCQLFEGIYEDMASDKGLKKNRYRLALKYIDDQLYLIYLQGANLYNDWKEGEYKALLEPTSTTNLFQARWLMANKTTSESVYVSFDMASMKVVFPDDNESNTYLKLFPTASDNISTTGISSDEWSGTGFALKKGYLVTNYHVVEDAKTIIVHGVNGDTSRTYSAKVVATDKKNDLAILKISDSQFAGFGPIPYSFKTQTAEVGENIWVLGYPLTQVLGNEIKLTNGVISSRSGYQGDVAMYQISAPVQPGNSGGPLFDSKGNIIGIVNASVSGAENVGYAIKSSYLRNLAESYSISSILPSNNSISTLALKDQVRRVNNFVFMLTCSSKITSKN